MKKSLFTFFQRISAFVSSRKKNSSLSVVVKPPLVGFAAFYIYILGQFCRNSLIVVKPGLSKNPFHFDADLNPGFSI